eukprot:2992086-Rhodomonas_salina.1
MTCSADVANGGFNGRALAIQSLLLEGLPEALGHHLQMRPHGRGIGDEECRLVRCLELLGGQLEELAEGTDPPSISPTSPPICQTQARSTRFGHHYGTDPSHSDLLRRQMLNFSAWSQSPELTEKDHAFCLVSRT